MFALTEKIFGSPNDKQLKILQNTVNLINNLEPQYIELSNDELAKQTILLKNQLAQGKTLEDILPEAFATCREAAKRTLKMRHFDVQLMGGIVLHKGMISEMKTGEGKTLVSTLPAYLNALTGNGVHLVTVNDYLAKRDAAWMGEIFKFLGLKVGCVYAGITEEERKLAYKADITYGTNNELGFDYLRDNLKTELESIAQRGLNYAIIDEVDSILIDEARTPLIISGPADDESKIYSKIVKIIPELQKEHFEIDEKSKTALLTEIGNDKVEQVLKANNLLAADSSLYDIENVALVHHINQALKAEHLYKNEVDYIVRAGKVEIIDEFTGRVMEGRRFSEGLHQALEAKENVAIQKENKTLASTTFQNYFRNYKKLAGMTGTALTEAAEFHSIYNLEVITIPTHKPEIRIDNEDQIYKNVAQKYIAIIAQIKECYKKKQPVLVGTVSIEKSEFIAKLLKKEKIPHHVLNAKHHSKEAHIIAQAGRAGAVTIATNMAGRGTDIMLGGNPEMLSTDLKLSKEAAEKLVEQEKVEVLKSGGLYVIGTERHESRRIDNQLRGRSARQGDPGETKFFLSLEDDLMRIFGSEKISSVMTKIGFKDDESIHHPWISKALEKAQKKVEAHNFEIRKNLIKFDDVLNEQRQVIYEKRREIITADKISGTILDFASETNQSMVASNIPAKSYIENWRLDTLDIELQEIYGEFFHIEEFAQQGDVNEADILAKIEQRAQEIIAKKRADFGSEIMNMLEKNILLMTLDNLWRDHLTMVDHLKIGINLRAYGQKDPLHEYKREAFEMFEALLNNLVVTTIKRIAHAQISANSAEFINNQLNIEPENMVKHKTNLNNLNQNSVKTVNNKVHLKDRDPNDPESWGKVGRNEPCPCGSGKKYKHCHGKI
ncbi:MAG: preprotein translocase subunit SecA [Rickettsiales bacterium]